MTRSSDNVTNDGENIDHDNQPTEKIPRVVETPARGTHTHSRREVADTSEFCAVGGGHPQQGHYASPYRHPDEAAQAPEPKPEEPPSPAQEKTEPSTPPVRTLVRLGVALFALITVASVFFLGVARGWFGSDHDTDNTPTFQPNDHDQNDSDHHGKNHTHHGSHGHSEEASSRPEHPELPAGTVPANDSARNNEAAGNLNNVYVVGGRTTESFARNVRDAFAKNYVATGELSTTLRDVHSPETHRHYDMECTDNGQYVRCVGGNNAVVIID